MAAFSLGAPWSWSGTQPTPRLTACQELLFKGLLFPAWFGLMTEPSESCQKLSMVSVPNTETSSAIGPLGSHSPSHSPRTTAWTCCKAVSTSGLAQSWELLCVLISDLEYPP